MTGGPVAGYQDYNSTLQTAAIDVLAVGFNQWVKIYNDTGSALTNGRVYQVIPKFSATIGPYLACIAVATQTAVVNWVGVVDNTPLGKGTIASTAFGYVMVRGYVDAFVDGTTDVAVNDELEVINAGSALIQNVASGSRTAAIDDNTVAIACEAQAANSAVLVKVLLLGKQCAVAAS